MTQTRWLRRLLPWGVAAVVLGLALQAARLPERSRAAAPNPKQQQAAERGRAGLSDVVERFDAELRQQWQASGVEPAPPATELRQLRRLSLSLMGTIPSLEEIRQFEADPRPDRLERFTDRWLDDPRFADYWAERLARAYVGKEDGQFIQFRRDRLVQWLSEQLARNRPYDALVRDLLTTSGLTTGQPAANFITAASANEEIDENKLAGKTVRAFLGQRIDCAQCHDHPFDHWKQGDFAGLAAHFGQVRWTLVGVEDKPVLDGVPVEFELTDPATQEKTVVAPRVPFHPEWAPATGSRRAQLAAWVTHPENRRFERAIANRVWALLLGRALLEPVDDLRDPPDQPDLLDLLGSDFRAHGCDLRRLIRVIVSTAPFRIDSTDPSEPPTDVAPSAAQGEVVGTFPWNSFPLARLRPEQVIGSLLQASSLQTIDQNSHLIFRAKKFFQENDFVRDYGDLGGDELLDRTGTIPQRLLLMNGRLAREALEANPFSAANRMVRLAPDDNGRIETAFLVCLTRRPGAEELAWFREQFAESRNQAGRDRAMEDLLWSLMNSTEFSFNH